MMASDNSWSPVSLLCFSLQLLILTGSATSSIKEENSNHGLWSVSTEGDVLECAGSDTGVELPADDKNKLYDVPTYVTEKRSWRSVWAAYSSLLKHFIPSYYKTPESIKFARFVRGRLGRMPISFGKRFGQFAFASHLNPRPVQELQRTPNNQHDTLDDNAEHDPEYNPEESPNDNLGEIAQNNLKQAGEIVNSLEFEGDAYRREHRARLSRMPLNFGKRVMTSGFIDRQANHRSSLGYLPSREIRGTFIRMPLTYGKKLTGHETETSGRLPVRAFPVRLLRMPKALGKQNLVTVERPVIGQQKSMLVRTPLTYRKRHGVGRPVEMDEGEIGEGVYNSMKTEQCPLNVEQISRVNRIPLTLGKRDRLGTMPFAFGKRDLSTASEDSALLAMLTERRRHHGGTL